MNSLQGYDYRWPRTDLASASSWRIAEDGRSFQRDMPESAAELAADSRWPAMFPAPLCFITTADGKHVALEKVVGATIVNRFPYVLALSFCRRPLSERHHARRCFTRMFEHGRIAAVQFVPPGSVTNALMSAVTSVRELQSHERLAWAGLPTRPAATNDAPVFCDAYMVCEGHLVEPGRDFDGRPVYEKPWIDVGSHRVYFLEIDAIQLRADLAEGQSQIRWRSLPAWEPRLKQSSVRPPAARVINRERYSKGYTPHYVFPSARTVAFEADTIQHGMAVKFIPPLPENQLEVDNDRARWPCFFPSSVGMITTWADGGVPNLMPCGSTSVLSRHPMIIAPCVSYAAINERYAPRASLEIIRRRRRFGCGVPFIHDDIVEAIRYAGNHSLADDRDKVANAGLTVDPAEGAPVLPALPVHFDCAVIGEVRLGTHVMFLGEVKRIRVRRDVGPDNPLRWCPWAEIAPAEAVSPAFATLCH